MASHSIFGALGDSVSGELRLAGERVAIRSVRDAIHNGLALLANDCEASGLFWY
jgi:ABC-type sugar transport system ATPase subunit